MTSTEEEKMEEGLKRAYAEVILNTTKEAAARVMAAEFRARRLEKQLALTTDEATRMLVRLKQMLDDEIKEAKSSSLNLQQKIDELECQLNEAEGIVIDLRAELHQVQKQLVEEKNKKQLPMGCNRYGESYEFATNGDNYNRGLFTPSLDALPELVIGNDKTLRSNADGVDDQCQDPSGERASSLQVEEETNPEKDNTASVIRKSKRKRKLKVWDDVMATLGLRRSGQCKKPRHTFPCISSCTTSMVKQCVDDDHQPLVEEEAEVEIEEGIDSVPENKELVDNDKFVKHAATAELSGSETEDEAGAATSSRFNHARRKLFKYAIGRKWKNLSTIYPEKGSCDEKK